MSYQQCTRFRTTLDLDHKYLWNGSSNRQAENGVINNDFSTFVENNLVSSGAITKKMTLTFDLWTWYSKGFVRLSRYMFMQNTTKVSAAVHECAQTVCPILQSQSPKIRSCDLDRRPMTLNFSWFQAVVKVQVAAKFHRAACSGSWVIVLTEKKLRRKQYSPSRTVILEGCKVAQGGVEPRL